MGFSAQVDDFITNSEALLLAVVQDASQEMIISAENPTIKGGNMRVDTGFCAIVWRQQLAQCQAGKVLTQERLDQSGIRQQF